MLFAALAARVQRGPLVFNLPFVGREKLSDSLEV